MPPLDPIHGTIGAGDVLAIDFKSCKLTAMRNPKFLGVYALKTTAAQKPRFFVWHLPDGNYAIQELDASLSQKGPARGVSPAALAKGFKAETGILAAPVTTPDFRPLLKTQGAAPEEDGQLAQLEKARKARQLENDLRDHFDKALRSLAKPKEKSGALAVLERIVALREGIVPGHKHMFRDFGVALRKRNLPELAMQSAHRVVALAPQDDHARFNLARILGILGRFREAEAQLEAARKIDPTEKVYARLAAHLKREQAKASQGASWAVDED